jgi:hypothetical protein
MTLLQLCCSLVYSLRYLMRFGGTAARCPVESLVGISRLSFLGCKLPLLVGQMSCPF